MKGINYEEHWDLYAKNWQSNDVTQKYIGDEWIGKNAGAADNLEEYLHIIESKFIAPYIDKNDDVVEMGIGGGRTASLLLKYCHNLTCADISQEMINAAKERLAGSPVQFVKLDGMSLNGIADNSADIFFCYDTMVHIEPRDIFNYLRLLPRILKGKKLAIIHHADVTSEYGFNQFLREYKDNLMGKRSGGAFSVMTAQIMEKFIQYLGFKIIHKDTTSVPRDCVWVLEASGLKNI